MRKYIARLKSKGIETLYFVVDLVTDSDKLVSYKLEKNGFHRTDYRFSKDQLMFVHLPKTGGTSITRLLEKDTKDRFAHLDIHKPVSILCSPKDYQYITVMRDPVSRVWSQYQMLLRSEKGYPYRNFALRGLETLLQKCWAVRNMNCRYLAADIHGEPNDETLILAKVNLANCFEIIDFDDFHNQVSKLMNKLELPVEAIPNERKAKYEPPDKVSTELILKYNGLDQALYNFWQNSIKPKEVLQ